MRIKVWLGMAASVGVLMSGAAMAQTQQVPQLFGKQLSHQQTTGRFDLQPQQQQETVPGPIIFGKQTRVPVDRSRTATYPPVYRRDDDRDHDRDWNRDRYRGRRAHNAHPGWNKGKKTGWGGCDVPPGQAKKVGCKQGHGWRDGDEDRDHRGRKHGKK